MYGKRLRRIDVGADFAVDGIREPAPLTGRAFDQTAYLSLLTRAQERTPAGLTDPMLTIRTGNDRMLALTPDRITSLVSQAMTWFEIVVATDRAMKDGTAAFAGGIPEDFTDGPQLRDVLSRRQQRAARR
ncbi:hypothetical protein SAMN05421538_1052 [Paracoccus isoporae]|uniref:Uncharacterized protein n=1 Tax=Paracoccus isoporae TaxID=591205 RepID=A0A1G7B7R9_9RHOB|nr:hypothetical protein [Paracoccus isoporae]SDE22880.1 hypothetical protein SAMN05421538_1052 [Paracoccus isoporae]